MSQAPRAILFDTFGTLVDWRTSLIDEFTAFGAARGLATDWTALVDAWRAAYHPSMERVRSGAQPWTKLDDLHRASLDALAPAHGLAGLGEADRAWMVLGWHRLRAWPDVPGGMARLHRRFITGPLSNGNVALLVALGRANALAWDVILGAEVVRAYKPDPKAYLGACELLSLPPGEVMLCAAHNHDLAAAQALGLQTAFLARPGEYGPAQSRDLVATGAWDHDVASLPELAERLGA